MGEDAQLTNVGTRLKRIIEERSNGETVEEILTALEENPAMLRQIADDIPCDESLYPQDLTPAAVTGSPILGRLQRDVSAATAKLTRFFSQMKLISELQREKILLLALFKVCELLVHRRI